MAVVLVFLVCWSTHTDRPNRLIAPDIKDAIFDVLLRDLRCECVV